MAKQKMPVKTAPMELAEDGYPGFVAHVRTNLASGYIRTLPDLLTNGLKPKEAAEIFLKLFPSWDGFVDDDGKIIPHTAAGLDAMPQDLMEAMWSRRSAAIKEAVMPSPLGTGSSEQPSEDEKG